MRKNRKGTFIVLEGPDKSGKSTQAGLLVRFLKKKNLPVVHTREPGGTSFAEAIRKILLNPRNKVHPLAELFLYQAARAQHTHEKILKALNSGAIVISERYSLATLAYQGYGRGLPLSLIRRLNNISTHGLTPNLTLLLSIPDSAFKNRKHKRPEDRLDRESADFRARVSEGYRRLARVEPQVIPINADRSIQETHQEIAKAIRQKLKI